MTGRHETVQRWLAAGGSVALLDEREGMATVLLCRCDGGEEQERFTTADAEVIALVRAHAD